MRKCTLQVESELRLADVNNSDATEQPGQSLVIMPRQRRPWVIVTVIALLITIGAATASIISAGIGWQSTTDAYIEGRVIRISPKVSGEVIALHVDDNSLVRAGEVLLEIDPSDYQAKVDQATAAVATADSGVQQAEAQVLSAEASQGEAEAGLRIAQTEERRRASDVRRYAAMGSEGVSEQQLETARAAADAATDQREAAEKKLAASAAALNVARTMVGSARSQALAARAQLRLAALNLEWTKVRAPQSGRITQKNVETGSFVSAGQPLFAIVPDDIWVLANFKEVQLKHMHVGQKVDIVADAVPDRKLTGHIQSFQAGTGARFELLPPENATGNWVKVVQRVPVKITFDAGQDLSDLTQGLSVEISVDTGSEGNRSKP
jgi:membrane fusion protein (multidrug efflux system)